jgi:23S rRNA (adenine1618-N6)-methyltransferase
MHPKNKHKDNYNLDELCSVYSPLAEFVFINKHQTKTIDFANAKAVKALNTALLKKHYQIKYWEFSDNNLCPPIPSRADYIHYLAELIPQNNNKITVLDIGTGATCIYPLLGNTIYKWNFIATDIDKNSIVNAKKIIKQNNLENKILFRLQKNKDNILKGIINPNDYFTISMCNPPFYKSEEDALKATNRKLKNLNLDTKERNFSGKANELWYKGGEKAFLHNYLYESSCYKKQFDWFSSLVSKKELIKDIKRSLKKLGATEIKVINMEQGNKISRIIAWRF